MEYIILLPQIIRVTSSRVGPLTDRLDSILGVRPQTTRRRLSTAVSTKVAQTAQMRFRQTKRERELRLGADVRVRPRDIHTSPSLVSRIAPAIVRPVVPRYRSTCLGVTDKICYRKLHIPHCPRQHYNLYSLLPTLLFIGSGVFLLFSNQWGVFPLYRKKYNWTPFLTTTFDKFSLF